MSPDLAHLPGLWTDAYLTAAAVRARWAWLGSEHQAGSVCCLACSSLPASHLPPAPMHRCHQPQGGARVEVEQRGGGAGEGFGKGHKAALSFGEALRRMAAGDSSLYLTTQAVELAPDGHPHLYASPVAELASDVPLLPRLMAPLVPQSVNLWAGAAREGAPRPAPPARSSCCHARRLLAGLQTHAASLPGGPFPSLLL